MPDAYDQDGGVNQEKRFSVAMQRYRSFSLSQKLDTNQAVDGHFVKFEVLDETFKLFILSLFCLVQGFCCRREDESICGTRSMGGASDR